MSTFGDFDAFEQGDRVRLLPKEGGTDFDGYGPDHEPCTVPAGVEGDLSGRWAATGELLGIAWWMLRCEQDGKTVHVPVLPCNVEHIGEVARDG